MAGKNWSTESIPNQNGRVVVVTGSSSGIGLEAARVLAGKQATIIIAVRSLKKGEAAGNQILAEFPDAELAIMELDLADLDSVKAFAQEYRENFSRLDLLINNAGVMIPPYSKTKDGFELQFGTNHLGHFALTGRLLDILANTNGSRIVNVSSEAHKYGNIDFDDLNWEKRKYKQWSAYGDSKIANLYFTFELDKRLKANEIDIIATAAHPGYTATDLQRNMGFSTILNGLFAQSISMGALPTLRAAFDATAKGGEFFGPNGFMGMRGYPVKVEPNDLSKEVEIARKLWAVSKKLTKVEYEILGKSSD